MLSGLRTVLSRYKNRRKCVCWVYFVMLTSSQPKDQNKNLSMSKLSSYQWPLFMFTLEHKIPEPSLACELTSLHLHSF